MRAVACLALCAYIMYMPQISVYIPVELADRVRGSGLNVSAVTQTALIRALDAQDFRDWLSGLRDIEPVHIPAETVRASHDAAKVDFEA